MILYVSKYKNIFLNEIQGFINASIVLEYLTMKLKYPSFYKNFSCIGSECKQSCCIGWELEVDSETFEYYKSVPGEFGNRLRRELKNVSTDDEEYYSFTLPVDGRCPFLNSNNLCDIVLNLGEEALCDICTTYPRYSFSYNDVIEHSLTISCEEACRLLFDENDDSFITHESELEYEYDDEDCVDEEILSKFSSTQKTLFDLLNNNSIDFEEKLKLILDGDEYPELNSKEERLRILSLLEPLNKEWAEYMEKLLLNINNTNSDWDNSTYSKLLTYFLYRYMPRGLFDEDLDSKIRFCLFCIFCVKDIEEITHDVKKAASLFSREVEHSEDNIYCIFEELLFTFK